MTTHPKRRWAFLWLGLAALTAAPRGEAQAVKPLPAGPLAASLIPGATTYPLGAAFASGPAVTAKLSDAGTTIAAAGIDHDPDAAAKAVDALFGEAGRGGEVSAPAVSVGPVPARAAPALGRAVPKTGTLGVDTSAMDLSVRPQDDFFRYVNGTWLKDFKMPADKARYGAFDALAEKSENDLKEIIVSGADPKAADLYASFMNTDAIEARGLKPMSDALARIDAVKSKDELAGAFARGQRQGVAGPVGLYVAQDDKNPAAYVTKISQAGLGLPDRDYYFNEGEKADKIRAGYIAYAAKLFALSGESDPAAKAAAVYSLEKALAAVQWNRVDDRDPEKTYNKIKADALAAAAPGFDWAAFLRESKIPASETDVVVSQPSYLTGFVKVLDETPLETWKLYMKLRALESALPYLPDAFVQAGFEFHGRLLNGQPEMRPRWKRGVDLVNGALGEEVAPIYVQKHFPEASRKKMAAMIENLRGAFGERIDAAAWMGDETKKKALEKLSKFTPKIGYPDKWRDYSRLAIVPDDLLGNVRRSALFDSDAMVAKLGKPFDRGEWDMLPQTVNAYYNPPSNEIVFPAAILQGVFFNPEADDAVNYGAIGGVIGHEMSHGFDDEGSQYDGDGKLQDWWTKKDRAEFEARTRKLVSQLNAYSPLPGKHVNGKLTLGENLGDLGGMTVAYAAYRRSLGGVEPPVIDGFTGDQRFFLGWAQVWRSAIRDEKLALQMATDPHSPAQYRVNGVVTNIPSFYKAFDLKEGDKEYQPEKDRVKIW